MKKLCATVAALLVTVGTAWAGSGPQLFKAYHYGMTKAEVAKLSGAVACQHANLRGSLCQPDLITFGGETWEQVFVMKDEKLTAVMLAREANEDIFQSILNVIAQSGFVLAYVQSDQDQADLVALAKQGASTATNRVTELFLRAENELTCSFIDAESLKSMKTKYKLNGIADVFLHAPKELREVDLTRKDGIIGITFAAPIVANAEIDEKSKGIKESF